MSSCCSCFSISLIEDEPLVINLLENPEVTFSLDLGTTIIGGGYPTYEGPYEAIPKVSEQIFETKKKSLEDDFTVKEITYLETPNIGGGFTVVIGET